ncbi:MAG: hypothetical protein EZS26_000042 [Candidatus Ordinivivax streblomastigis]|uniref:Uncharacterized protein n=1 Tax=Candidatus Ordinivivax streblomastigis TaxID=2540710 RepID=A0A5M8P504_9BACT|nr:MAG: hypothetical protein EZS26_000042 [Candidatus Ordinivivax streblomastigis]
MLVPSKMDYKKIQRNVVMSDDIVMSICGNGSCKSSIRVMHGGNCTCGAKCNAPTLQNYLSIGNRVRL